MAYKVKKQGAKTGFVNLVGKDFDTLNQSQKDKMLKAVLELLGLTENSIIL